MLNLIWTLTLTFVSEKKVLPLNVLRLKKSLFGTGPRNLPEPVPDKFSTEKKNQKRYQKNLALKISTGTHTF